MGGILESVFGSWGAVIVQVLVTIVVVLALIALVYWMVRRNSAGGLGRIGRGRVPRLALVDAMAVDGRRRLVLVRRDNVEHLIMIGGPADVVVEAGIQRPRRPKTAGQNDDALLDPGSASDTLEPARLEQVRSPPLAKPGSERLIADAPTPRAAAAPGPTYTAPEPTPLQAAAPPTPIPPYNGARNGSAHNGNGTAPPNDGERPFSFRRATPSAPPSATPAPTGSPPLRGPMQPLPPATSSRIADTAARVMDFEGPTRIEQPLRLPQHDKSAGLADMSDLDLDDDELPPEDELPSFLTQTTSMDVANEVSRLPEPQRGPAAMNPFARQGSRSAPEPAPQHDPETVKRVGDLEREMARLLGEITAKPS